jgi:hypothetical protein
MKRNALADIYGARMPSVPGLGLIFALILSGCASVNSVSISPVPAQRQRPVAAQVEKTIFLGLNFNNDFVNDLVPKLQQQCPNGVISGVLTKDESINYFIATKRVVQARGFCQAASR